MSVSTYKPNSTDCAAYSGVGDLGEGSANVNSSLTDFATALSGGDLTNVSTDDANFHSISNGAYGAPGHRVKIKIAETPADISKITITAKGYGDTMAPGWWLFAYNVTSGLWEYTGVTHATGSKDTLTFDITSSIASYIDGTGFFNFCVHTVARIGLVNYDYLYYAECVVTYTAAPTTSIKKVNGVAYASIKKICGVAIASVKKVSGLS